MMMMISTNPSPVIGSADGYFATKTPADLALRSAVHKCRTPKQSLLGNKHTPTRKNPHKNGMDGELECGIWTTAA